MSAEATTAATSVAEREQAPTTWVSLLEEAVARPGMIHTAYTTFYGYSIGNQLLAMFQCLDRGLAIGPIATYKKWGELGRQVRKGEHALTLCMPVTIRVRRDDVPSDEQERRTVFTFKARWFALGQTEGAEQVIPEPVGWNREQALAELAITETPFTSANGNVQGMATPAVREICINPLAALPLKTTIHEIAHVLLHGDDAAFVDDETPNRALKEVEAESVALIVLESLGEPGAEYCRGYIQNWLAADSKAQIPETNARRIFAAAEKILRAGRNAVACEVARLKAENATLAQAVPA